MGFINQETYLGGTILKGKSWNGLPSDNPFTAYDLQDAEYAAIGEGADGGSSHESYGYHPGSFNGLRITLSSMM